MTPPGERLWFETKLRRGSDAEIEAAPPDPIAADVFGGISRRALAQARDDRSSATTQYEQAVRQARANGWTWAEIGRILGVSRQVLHRRFRQRPPD